MQGMNMNNGGVGGTKSPKPPRISSGKNGQMMKSKMPMSPDDMTMEHPLDPFGIAGSMPKMGLNGIKWPIYKTRPSNANNPSGRSDGMGGMGGMSGM